MRTCAYHRLVAGTAIGGLLAIGAMPLAAQVAPAAAATPAAAEASQGDTPPTGDPAQTTAAEERDVIVTGSRVVQNGNNQPTPVTVVSTQQLLQNTPSTVVAALQTLPVFAGMRSPTGSPGNSRQNNAARVVNLRNLGRLRTLALFDGKRLAPSSPEGETDTAFIPSLLVSRVDVVTGGASAVYGSDAVSGVVNFVTNRNFDGVKLDTHYGISSRGDGPEFKFGIAGGGELFGGRGHIEGTYEYFDAPGIRTRLTRDFGARVYTVQGAGTAAAPYTYIQNTRLSSTSFNGYISGVNAATNVGNPLRDMVFSSDGVLTPFQHGAPVVSGTLTVAGIESGGDGGFYDKTWLQALYRSHSGYARFDFDVTDTIHFYATGTAWSTHNYNANTNNEFRNITLSATNAFLSPAYQQAMTSRGITSFTFSRLFEDKPPTDAETYTSGYMGSVGFEGKLGDYRWEAFWAPSRNQQRTRANYNINNGRAFAALDAVRDPAGNIVCNVTLTNPGLYPGCVPINLFGPTATTDAAFDYITDTTRFVATTNMDEFGASIAGSPFGTWAGPVQVALSGEYRKLTYSQFSNAQPTAANCTGLRFNNCRVTTLQYASNVLADLRPVSQKVSEGALEVELPLLADVPFVQSFNVNGALRFTHYDTTGDVTTWKLGATWQVSDELTLRATRSRDIRAPNLIELFAPQLVQVGSSNRDIHTGLITGASLITASNPNLKPEIAKVWTAGIVYKPAYVPRLSLAFDIYRIRIDNAITAIQGQDTNTQRLCEDSGGTSEFCSLIVRPLAFSDRSAANLPTAFLSQPRNALRLETWGLDVEGNYNAPIANGNLALRALVSWQPHEYLTLPGGIRYDAAGAGYGPCCQLDGVSRWRAVGFVNYTHGGFSFDLQERWQSGVRWDPNTALVFAVPDRPSIAYTNVTLGQKIDQFDLFLSVQNLFDKQPTPWGRVSHGASPGLFGGFVPGQDVIGRYLTVGVRLNY